MQRCKRGGQTYCSNFPHVIMTLIKKFYWNTIIIQTIPQILYLHIFLFFLTFLSLFLKVIYDDESEMIQYIHQLMPTISNCKHIGKGLLKF